MKMNIMKALQLLLKQSRSVRKDALTKTMNLVSKYAPFLSTFQMKIQIAIVTTKDK